MRFILRFLLPAFCLMLLTLSSVCAQRVELMVDEGDKVENPPEEVELIYKFEDKEARRYDITVTGSGGIRMPGEKEHKPFLSRTEYTFIKFVKDYDDEEKMWRMGWNMMRGQMLLPDFGQVTVTVPPASFRMNKYGSIENWEEMEAASIAPGMPQGKALKDIFSQLRFAGFPEKAVKIDDEWEDEYIILVPGADQVTIKTKSKLLAFERLKEKDCVKIYTTYETPFKLDVIEEDSKKKDSEAEGAGDKKEEKRAIVGREKGEIWTYFAYEEGKIIQSFGTMELTADVKTGDDIKPPSRSTDADDIRVSPIPDWAEDEKELTHDFEVTFHMVSKFNPDIPGVSKEEEIQ